MNCKPGMEPLANKIKAWVSEMDDGCWYWEGSRSKKGYGRIWWQGKLHAAHRMAYTAWNGPVPDGLHVLHRCDTPQCANPLHLFVGTNRENVLDKRVKNRIPRGESRTNAKLTDAAVRDIRSSGLGKKALSKKYGVCPTVILEVKRGIRWPHVRDPGDDATDETLEWIPVPTREVA